MDPRPYRFVPSASLLERLFNLYEDARRAGGSGTTLHRVSPGQRVDAVVVMLGLNASSGWRRQGDETAESLWLRYLTPVLAETRESAAALAVAVAQCLPGRFEPPFESVKPPPPPPPPPPPRPVRTWSDKIAIWLEDARNVLLGRRVLSVLALAAIVAIGAGLYLYWPQPAIRELPYTPPIAGNGSDIGGENTSSPAPAADNPDQASEYRRALALTLGAVQQNDGAITPRLLARIYAGESDMLSEPAIFLSAMLRDWPLPPDATIPRNAAGRWALQRYAATFAAVENKTPPLDQLPPLDTNTPADARLQRALDQLVDGRQVASSEQPAADRWPDWLRWLAFLPLLPALAWSAASLVTATKASLVNAGKENRGEQAFLPIDSMAALTALPPERRLARQISWSEPVPGRRLDSERSIRATLTRGGYLTPVVRLRRYSAPYVFLVRRQHRNDQERDRVSRLIDALARGGVPLDVYDYDPDPRWLFPRSLRPPGARPGAGAPEDRPAGPVLDLRGLRELHPDARLVLVTDGTELVDYFTQRPLPFVSSELATWPKRMLLTPVPLAEWGEREMNLADALGSAIGRATIAGFGDLAKVFGSRSYNMTRPAQASAAFGRQTLGKRLLAWLSTSAQLLGNHDIFPSRPRPLRFDDPSLTSDAEPPAAQRDAIVAALREWLGFRGFQWLAACAFYPQLRSSITLYLGLNITIQRGPIAQPLYDETLLAQLTLLPWFRTGHMPTWLRRALAAALPKGASDRARSAVSQMLREKTTEEQTALTIWQSNDRGPDIPPDEVMADLMMRDIDDAITPSVSGEAFADLFKKHIDKALRRRAMLVGGTAFWCAGAAFFWPAPGASPHPNGAWLALLAYGLATIAMAALLFLFRALSRREARV